LPAIRILFLDSYPLPLLPTSLIINKRDAGLRISLFDEKRFGGGITKLLPHFEKKRRRWEGANF